MSDLLLLLVTGLGLGALYFLAASGLSLIYGLMGVLNFAHGVFMTAGAYAGWLTMRDLPPSLPVGARLVSRCSSRSPWGQSSASSSRSCSSARSIDITSSRCSSPSVSRWQESLQRRASGVPTLGPSRNRRG